MTRYLFVVLLLVPVAFSSCVNKRIHATAEPVPAEKYSSGFPAENATSELEKITRSVKKVYSVSTYTTYQFRLDARITGFSIHQGSYKKAAWGVVTTNETVFGTATVLGFSEQRVSLLTCAHVVSAPDTLISFFEATGEDPTRYIQSFSIKEKQENWVKDLSSCGPFTLLASDLSTDIAILGKNCESLADTVVPFPYPPGKARDIGWGSFVYVFGYPMGNQVITTGIASPAPKRPMGEFSIDALLNKGYSGGIILAIRNGVPDFELAGIVKTVSSTREEYLKPAENQQYTPDWLPYKGNIHVGNSDNIQYGLNAVVPVETILDFYNKHRKELIIGGYNLDGFFYRP